MLRKHTHYRSALCLVAALAGAITVQAETTTQYCTPIGQPLTLEFVATNEPATGGTLDYRLRITPTRDIDHLQIVLATEGVLELTAPLNETIDDAAEGVTIERTGSANITEIGGGTIYAAITESSTTPCTTLLGTSEIYTLSVLDDGEVVRAGNLTVMELAIERINEMLADEVITEEEAGVLLALLAEDEIDLDEPTMTLNSAPRAGDPPGDTTITGQVQWTDASGNLHPARFITVKAFENMLELDDTTTDAAGNFTLTIIEALLGEGPTDLRIRAYADNRASVVTVPTADNDPDPYTYNVFATLTDVETGSSRVANLTIDTASDARRSFGIADATLVGQDYVTGVDGSAIPKIRVRSPVAGASNYNGTVLSINTTKWQSWDVLLHEFGHYIQRHFSIQNSPGGAHNIGQDLIATHGIDPGTRLSWGEGHATYLMYQEQQRAIAAGTMPAVQWPGGGMSNDSKYHSVGWGYDLEANEAGYTFVGEQDEINTTRILLDWADSSNDGKETTSFGDSFIWTSVKAASPSRLSDVWNALIAGLTIPQKLTYATALLQNAVGPENLDPPDNAGITVSDPVPDFTWDEQTLNDFRVVFYDSDDHEVFATDPLGDVDFYTPTADEWAALADADYWLVEGRNDDGTVQTGWYPSERHRLGGVDFAFVIDDTGSMSEEIGGVRAGLLSFLSSFDPSSDDVTFQLTTFKDGPFSREPTKDVATIQAQVSALFASGGGDCPEDAVGGLLAGSERLKRGGTLYFATDANAHAGTDEGSVLTGLRDKGVRVNIMQTGTCDDEGTGFSTAALAARGSSNNDGDDGPSSALALVGSGDFANSIDFYSQLAAATGGSYIYIPEVNFFSGDGAVYFANTVENVLFATIAPRIVSATPHNVPRGSIVSVELAAQGTSFLNDTTVEFAGAGIAVNAIERLSAVSLRVTLQIADDAPLGFSDATAQTVLSDEVTESALGEGILSVVDAVSTPTLLSASPSVVHLGDTVDVTLHAGATHFVDGTSVSNFGGGITINSVTVSNDTSAVANITVADDATPGFRNVSVTTDTEFAPSTGSNFFRVAAEADVPSIINIDPTTVQRNQEVDVVVTLENFELAETDLHLQILGGGIDVSNLAGCGNVITAHLSISSTAAFGARDVIVESGGASVVRPNGITVAGVSESIDPIVRTIDPVGGPSEGGYSAVIGGEDFTPNAVVKWNGAEIDAVVSEDGTEITVTVPPGTPGRAVAVDVSNPGAMHSGRVIFFYDAAPGEKGADGPAGADGKDGPTGEPPAGGTTPPETIIYQQVVSQACGNGLCGAFGASMFAVVMLTLVTAKLARRRRRR